jgi:MFS family permease
MRFSRSARQFTAGGSWTDLLPEGIRINLRWFWLDGLFASSSEAIIVTYQTLFILALGASESLIGLLSSLSSLSGVLMLLPGALLAERFGKRKEVALYSGGVLGRLILLVMVFVPLFFSGPAAIWFAVGLTVLRDGLNNLGLPAWTSLSADLVPIAWRGRYFGSRNFIMGAGAMITTLIFGEIITRSGQIQGYQFAYGFAFLIGMVSTFSFAKIKEPLPQIPVAKKDTQNPPLSLFLKENPAFFLYCFTSAIWNFSLNFAGPFFTPYQVKVLSASATMVGILTIVSQISSLVTQQPFGILTDRWGPRRIILLTGFLIPALPFAWLFITEAWQAIPVNLVGGALWAGYSLASFNFLLILTPEDQRARYSAIYQIVVLLSLSAGAAAGSLAFSKWGYTAVFAGSAIGRMIAAILFARFVRPLEVKSRPDGKLE